MFSAESVRLQLHRKLGHPPLIQETQHANSVCSQQANVTFSHVCQQKLNTDTDRPPHTQKQMNISKFV